jgi:hypothetical protein
MKLRFSKINYTKLIPSLTLSIILIAGLIAFQGLKRSSLKAETSSFQLSPAPQNSSYLYQSLNQLFKLYLGDRKEEAKPKVKFEQQDSSVEFSPFQLPSHSAKIEKPDNQSLVYKELWPGIDLKYSITEEGLKEEIIISNQTSALSHQPFKFSLNLKNTVIRKPLDNQATTYFIDAQDGQYRFHLPQPFMIDAVGNRSEAIKLQILSQSDLKGTGSYEIILEPDTEWLKRAVYPVIIDPTVVHNEDTEFTGTENRVDDEDSGSTTEYITEYHELPADEHTVALWHMNESSWTDDCSTNTVTDDSGNANHGKACPNGSGPDTTSNSKLGTYAGSFDGVSLGDVIKINAGIIDSWPEGTISAWIYVDDHSKENVIFSDSNGSDTYPTWFRTLSSGNELELRLNSAARATTSGLNMQESTWYHVAGTWDGANAKIYVNGIEKVSSSYTGTSGSSTGKTYIGCWTEPPQSSAQYFDGLIDEVRISNVARTPEEIKTNAQRRPYGVYTSQVVDFGSTPDSIDSLSWSESGVQTGDGETLYSSTDLIGHWKLNETSGTNATDSSDEGNNGTLNGFSDTSGQDVVAGSGWTADNRRWGAGALMFDGSNDYVDIPHTPQLVAQYSAELWVFIEGTSSVAPIFMGDKSGAASQASRYRIQIPFNSGYFTLYCTHGGSTYHINTNKEPERGKWQHIAFTWQEGAQYVYLNGKEVGSGTANIDFADFVNVDQSEIGRSWYNNNPQIPFDGVIDSVRIYSRILSADEILSNYQAGNIEFQTRSGADSSPDDGSWEAWKPTTSETQLLSQDTINPVQQISTTNLKAYWKLDETSGTRYDTLTGCGGSGCDLTDNGTVTYSTGRLNNAGQFNASASEYLSHDDHADLSTGDIDFTAAAWVYLDSKAVRPIVEKGNNTAGYGNWEWGLRYTTTDRFRFAVQDGVNSDANVEADNLGSPSLSTWYLVIGWHDATNNTINIQVNNGTVNSAAYTAGSWDSNHPFAIGKGSGSYFEGRIDEVAFWKRTLTAAEKTQLYEDGFDQHNDPTMGGIYQNLDTTTYYEGSGSEKITTGAPQVDGNTVALWHLEETNGDLAGDDVFDETANNNDGEFNGSGIATSVVDGIFGKARSFNGVDDYIVVAHDSSQNITGGITISAWVSINTVSGAKTIVDKMYTADAKIQYAFDITDDELYFAYKDQSAAYHDYQTSSANLSTNTWYHVAVSFTFGTGSSMKMFVNGSEESGSWLTNDGNGSALSGSRDLWIGRQEHTSFPNLFDGIIDELRISNVAHTAEEIAEVYRAGRDHRLSRTISSTDLSSKTKLPFYIAADRPGTYLEATIGESAYANYEPDANTVGFWHLEENSGYCDSGETGCVKDSSSSGNDGTPSSAPYTVQGKIGKGWEFDGSDDYIDCGEGGGDFDNMAEITVSLWAKSTAVLDYFISKYPTSGTRSWAITLNASGKAYAVVFSNASNYDDWSSSSVVNDGNWHHIVMTYSSADDVKLYIDGALNGSLSTDNATGNIADSAEELAIGARTGGTTYNFDGTIDEVRVSDTARSADEIRQAYEIGRRTHPITIDFGADLDGVDIAGTSEANALTDTAVTIDATAYGFEDKGNNLFKGDKVIVRENYGGTEYIVTGTVTAVTASSGAVTVASWSGTVPNPGTSVCGGSDTHCFTANARVFKWQREWFDVSGPLSGHVDATTKITLRVTDGSEGRTFWLDDFRSGGAYLTDSSGSTVSSTAQRYFQYRIIFSTTDTAVSPSVTSVTTSYTEAGIDVRFKGNTRIKGKVRIKGT